MRARILVVDDEPGMLRAVERVLEPRHEVFTASSASEAMTVAETHRPDVAIVDIRMPEADGFELMRRLGAAEADADVILMTGSATDADAMLVRAIRERAFYFIQKPFDREVLWTLVERCLELRRLKDDNRRHVRRLETELAQARRFQQSLFPPIRAEIGGVRIDARCLPSAELGGDLFDYTPVGDRGAAVVVADVAGHGASAAMLTALVKSAFRASHVDDYAPLAVLDRVAAAVEPFSYEKLITLVCARIGSDDGHVDYANAGHPPGLARDPSGRVLSLSPTGPVISPALTGVRWSTEALTLGPGGRLLLFTDGVTEAEGADGPFGTSPLERHLAGAPRTGERLLDDVIESVREVAAGRPIQDDLTLLTAAW